MIEVEFNRDMSDIPTDGTIFEAITDGVADSYYCFFDGNAFVSGRQRGGNFVGRMPDGYRLIQQSHGSTVIN